MPRTPVTRKMHICRRCGRLNRMYPTRCPDCGKRRSRLRQYLLGK
jgi:rubrerythrin